MIKILPSFKHFSQNYYFKLIKCSYCSIFRASSSFTVTFNVHGKASDVLKSELRSVDALGNDDALIRVMVAPINPVDINVIEGRYVNEMFSLPAIAGYECVGKVEEVGRNVKHLKPGDTVIREIVADQWWGTWRTLGVGPASYFRKIPSNVNMLSAAVLSVNMCTAYRLLQDFVVLKEGDVIVHNGANSNVGLCIIQLAAKKGIVTVNIVRNRPNFDILESKLKSLGANIVITDSEFASRKGTEIMKSLHKPKLALNCVAGKSAANLIKFLDVGGTLVTYGGMSKQPNIMQTGPMIFQDILLRGFSIARWNKTRRLTPAADQMWNDLCNMLINEKLVVTDFVQVDLKDYKAALEQFAIPFQSKKILLTMP